MGRAVKANWVKWFDDQSPDDKRTIAIGAIQRLIEIDEVRFYADDRVNKDGNHIPEESEVEEHLYWESCGEDMRIPF